MGRGEDVLKLMAVIGSFRIQVVRMFDSDVHAFYGGDLHGL
jgi:hypothetical protein